MKLNPFRIHGFMSILWNKSPGNFANCHNNCTCFPSRVSDIVLIPSLGNQTRKKIDVVVVVTLIFLEWTDIMALVDFAPIRIPFYRRIQTFAVVLYYYSFYFGAFLGAAVILLILFSSYYPLALLYLGWAYLYDKQTPSHGGRRSKFMRNLKIWKYFRDYFPIKMIKTVDLDPQGNYIFGYHPHGILCAGAFCCFATEATDFSQVFPGITPHLLPLMGMFVRFRDILSKYYATLTIGMFRCLILF